MTAGTVQRGSHTSGRIQLSGFQALHRMAELVFIYAQKRRDEILMTDRNFRVPPR
jgi:hypothetical protein